MLENDQINNFQESMILDYKPPTSNLYAYSGSYLEDVENWGTPRILVDDIRSNLWPIPFDYFRYNEKQYQPLKFGYQEIVESAIFKKLGLCSSAISTSDSSDTEIIRTFLTKGKLPKKGEHRPIQEGILAVGSDKTDFMVVISSPNRFGDPGRMYIYKAN